MALRRSTSRPIDGRLRWAVRTVGTLVTHIEGPSSRETWPMSLHQRPATTGLLEPFAQPGSPSDNVCRRGPENKLCSVAGIPQVFQGPVGA